MIEWFMNLGKDSIGALAGRLFQSKKIEAETEKIRAEANLLNEQMAGRSSVLDSQHAGMLLPHVAPGLKALSVAACSASLSATVLLLKGLAKAELEKLSPSGRDTIDKIATMATTEAFSLYAKWGENAFLLDRSALNAGNELMLAILESFVPQNSGTTDKAVGLVRVIWQLQTAFLAHLNRLLLMRVNSDQLRPSAQVEARAPARKET